MDITIIKTPNGCYAGELQQCDHDREHPVFILQNPIMLELVSTPVMGKVGGAITGVAWNWTVVQLHTKELQIATGSQGFAMFTVRYDASVPDEQKNPLARLYMRFMSPVSKPGLLS